MYLIQQSNMSLLVLLPGQALGIDDHIQDMAVYLNRHMAQMTISRVGVSTWTGTRHRRLHLGFVYLPEKAFGIDDYT